MALYPVVAPILLMQYKFSKPKWKEKYDKQEREVRLVRLVLTWILVFR